MLTLIEALNFRCLRYVRQPLAPFHVLVGANASGKTTFLDVIALLGRLVSSGPLAAVEERTSNFQDLTWNRSRAGFELAIEARIPDDQQARVNGEYDRVRYEVSCGLNPKTQELASFPRTCTSAGARMDRPSSCSSSRGRWILLRH